MSGTHSDLLCPSKSRCFVSKNHTWGLGPIFSSYSEANHIQNSDYMTRINGLYWSLTSPVVLCIQNSVLSIRNTSLNVSQPSSVVFTCKTATLGPELQVSMDPKPQLWFCAWKQRPYHQTYKSLWVPDLPCGSVNAKQCAKHQRCFARKKIEDGWYP